jgi:glycerophosphoryl diester phosphodiesterase
MNYNTNIFIWTVLIVFSISCNKQDPVSDNTRFGDKIMILGHSGMGVAYSWPGNSKESITTCLEIGCDGSEIDVQLTLDSVLVAYHDEDLKTQTNCFGKIHETLWNDIASCQYNQSLNSSKIISMDELFSNIPNLNNFYFSFDCKTEISVSDLDAFQYRFLRAVKQLCQKHNIENHIFLEGTKQLLLKAKELQFNSKLLLNSYTNLKSDIDTCKKYNFFGMSYPVESDIDVYKTAFNNGIRSMVWSPNNYYQNKNGLEKQPDILQTDDPITLLKLIKRYNYESVRP